MLYVWPGHARLGTLSIYAQRSYARPAGRLSLPLSLLHVYRTSHDASKCAIFLTCASSGCKVIVAMFFMWPRRKDVYAKLTKHTDVSGQSCNKQAIQCISQKNRLTPTLTRGDNMDISCMCVYVLCFCLHWAACCFHSGCFQMCIFLSVSGEFWIDGSPGLRRETIPPAWCP